MTDFLPFAIIIFYLLAVMAWLGHEIRETRALERKHQADDKRLQAEYERLCDLMGMPERKNR